MAQEYTAPAPGTEDDDADDSGMVMDNPSGEESTALLPTDFFQGKELTPGAECKVRIRRVLQDQVEVTYVPHGDAEPDIGDEQEASEPKDEEMSGYMNE